MCSLQSFRSAKPKTLTKCPECGGKLLLGSVDPCEGDYYWCEVCGEGPFLFPLYYSEGDGA